MLTHKTLKSRLHGVALLSLLAFAITGTIIGAPQDDKVYNVGNGVSAAAVLSKVDPSYTTEAHDARIAGTVLLQVTVGSDGLAHDINVIKHLGYGLDEKAVEALQQWHFKPGMKDGEAVSVRATIEVNFRFR